MCAPALLAEVERQSIGLGKAEQLLDSERQRAAQLYSEARRTRQKYHQLFLSSQERHDHMLALLEEARSAAGAPESPSA